MTYNLLSYYEKSARRKVLKRSLLGRVILGIEGTKQRNRDALYLVGLPVDIAIVVGRRMRLSLPINSTALFANLLCIIALKSLSDLHPSLLELFWFHLLFNLLAGVLLFSIGKAFLLIYRGEFQ